LAQTQGEVVLIVDDQPDNLSLLHDALDDAGYTVLVATDGPSAIARAQQARPAIVLLDAMMPGMDGLTTLSRIREREAGALLPVIFVTAKVGDAEIAHGEPQSGGRMGLGGHFPWAPCSGLGGRAHATRPACKASAKSVVPSWNTSAKTATKSWSRARWCLETTRR
jgi:CheY-like chemotaxis protein